MKNILIAGLILSIFALTTAIPMGLCAQPPPSTWPPEEQWHPMSPDEAIPDMRVIMPYGGDYDLALGEPFVIRYGWFFLPTNVAYDYVTGEPVTAYANLQDRTDHAKCRWTIWVDGEIVEPKSLRAVCRWYRFWNNPSWPRPPRYEGEYWAVAPTAVSCMNWIEYPQGLSSGDHNVYLELVVIAGGGFRTYITTLHVSS